jgi:hypothetical protein
MTDSKFPRWNFGLAGRHLPEVLRGGDRVIPLCLSIAAVALLGVTPAAADSCEALASLSLPHATITLAEAVSSAGWPMTVTGRTGSPHAPFCRIAATIKPTSDSDIKVEVWMPSIRLERRFSGRGQRWMVGGNQLQHDGQCALQRIRYRFDRYWPCWQQRQFRVRASGKANRLRVPVGARDDHGIQVHHRGFLRRCAAFFVLERLLGRRQARSERGAALPRRFRRHRRWIAGRQLDGPRSASHLGCTGGAQGRC